MRFFVMIRRRFLAFRSVGSGRGMGGAMGSTDGEGTSVAGNRGDTGMSGDGGGAERGALSAERGGSDRPIFGKLRLPTGRKSSIIPGCLREGAAGRARRRRSAS